MDVTGSYTNIMRIAATGVTTSVLTNCRGGVSLKLEESKSKHQAGTCTVNPIIWILDRIEKAVQKMESRNKGKS
jgi:hypothetical protein